MVFADVAMVGGGWLVPVRAAVPALRLRVGGAASLPWAMSTLCRAPRPCATAVLAGGPGSVPPLFDEPDARGGGGALFERERAERDPEGALSRRDATQRKGKKKKGTKENVYGASKMRGHVALNARLVGLQNASDVLDVWATERAAFNEINLCTALYRCAKFEGFGVRNAKAGGGRLHPRSSPRLAGLMMDVAKAVEEGEVRRGRNLGGVAHSAARLARKFPAEASAVLRAVELRLSGEARKGVSTLSEFDAQSLCNLAWAYASVNASKHGRGDAQAEAAGDTNGMQQGHVQQVDGMCNHAEVMHLVEDEVASRLASASSPGGAPFTPLGMSNLLWSFAVLGAGKASTFNALGASLVLMLESDVSVANRVSLTVLGSCVWAFATRRYASLKLFAVVGGIVAGRCSELKARDLARIPWAFAKAGVKDSLLFESVANELAGRPHDDLGPQQVSHLCWAFAKVAPDEPWAKNTLKALWTAHVRKMHGGLDSGVYSPQAVANVGWAWGRCGLREAEVLYSVGQAVEALGASKFSAQNLCNLMWALAVLELRSHTLADLVGELGSELASRSVEELKAHHVSLALWAMRKVSRADDAKFDAVFRELAPVVTTKLPEFDAQSLSTVAWAYADSYAAAPSAAKAAHVESYALPLFNAIDDLVDNSTVLSNASGIDFSHLAWAFASVRHPGGRCLPALETALLGYKDSLNPQCVCNIAWAFAKLGHTHSDALFASLSQRATSGVASYSDAELSVLLWSFTINRYYPLDLFAAAFSRSWSTPDVPADAKVRIFQAHLALTLDLPDHGLVLDADSWEACTAAFLLTSTSAEGTQTSSSSELHMDVSASLGDGGLGLLHANEHVTDQGFVLDIAIEVDDQIRLAIEVDGPSHFLHGPTQGVYTGSTRLKHRLLRRLGWTVLSVPYYEWNRLKTDAAKQAYLSDAIAGALSTTTTYL